MWRSGSKSLFSIPFNIFAYVLVSVGQELFQIIFLFLHSSKAIEMKIFLGHLDTAKSSPVFVGMKMYKF